MQKRKEKRKSNEGGLSPQEGDVRKKKRKRPRKARRWGSSLATGPRFVETQAMTTLGGYVTGKRGQVCVVPKTQQGYSLVQSPAPQGEKVTHWLKGGEWDA